jgi:glycerol-3-phosphate O-acyltransferase
VARVDLRRATRELGVEICRAINGLTTAQGSAVAAAALLAGPGEALREAELGERVRQTCELLELLDMPLSEGLCRNLEAGQPAAAAEVLIQAGRVERRGSPRGDLLQIARGGRDALDYYRTSLTPALAWPAALALALREPGPLAGALERAADWLDLLELEYFPVPGAEREARLARVAEHQCARGWLVRGADGGLEVSDEGRAWQDYWLAQVQPVLECYAALIEAAARCEGEQRRQAVLQAATDLHRERLVLGEDRHSEGVFAVACGNALDWLVGREILVCDGPPQASDARLRPGRRFGQLAALRLRVASALRSR